jgi:hypothetical protein
VVGLVVREAEALVGSIQQTLEKHVHVFFYLTVFSKLLMEVRSPGFFEKIRHCRMDPTNASASRTTG